MITLDLLTSLRSSSLQEPGTESGSALTNGPLRRCKAVVTVSVVESGATLAPYLEQSSDNSTFYKVPGSDFLDPSDGAAIDAVGQYSVLVDLTMRYVRAAGVVATDDVTWRADLGVIE